MKECQIICDICNLNEHKTFDSSYEMMAEMYWHKKGYCKGEVKK